MRRLITLTNPGHPAIILSFVVDFSCHQAVCLVRRFVFEIYTGTSREQVSGGLFIWVGARKCRFHDSLTLPAASGFEKNFNLKRYIKLYE